VEGVDIRLTAKAATEEEADKLIDALGKTLLARLPNYIYGVDKDELESIVGQMLTTRHMTLATAESCTGGLISNRITKVQGSSNYFLRGYVVYSNEAKSDMLKVDPKLIKNKGAVSAEVAEALALNARTQSNASIAISTTGIAGPTGGSEEKPVGLVYMGLSDDQTLHTLKFQFRGDREEVQFRASQAALEVLRRHCLGLPLNEEK
jgi:nicotinamide-nucleotide amidase